MPRRSKQLDYRILNSTGEKVLRDTQNITSTSPTDSSSIKPVQAADSMADEDPQTKIMDNRAEALILMEEIDDLIEENPHDQLSVEDAKIIISKLDEKRALLRRLQFNRSLEDEDKLTSLVMSKLSSVRDYMKASTEYKNQKQRHNEKASKELAASKERSTLFIIEDVQRTIGEVRSEIETDLGNASDHQLIQMQNNFKHISSKIDKVAQKYELLLLSPIINAGKLIDIQDIGNRYMKLTKDSQVYHRTLEKVIEERDIHKQRSFDESKLNICLEKFSGYDSSTDIFTFQSTFNNLYLQSTPKRMLPDLFKNNLLKGSALTLVKSLNNIDQIWKSLKSAYGDTKLLLAKQLQKLSNNNSLQRTKDPEQLVQSLGDVINIMKELMKLAKHHQIEESLFYGDGLDRIYNNIGDARLTRWLTKILYPKQHG